MVLNEADEFNEFQGVQEFVGDEFEDAFDNAVNILE